jgi:hypothetical protein
MTTTEDVINSLHSITARVSLLKRERDLYEKETFHQREHIAELRGEISTLRNILLREQQSRDEAVQTLVIRNKALETCSNIIKDALKPVEDHSDTEFISIEDEDTAAIGEAKGALTPETAPQSLKTNVANDLDQETYEERKRRLNVADFLGSDEHNLSEKEIKEVYNRDYIEESLENSPLVKEAPNLVYPPAEFTSNRKLRWWYFYHTGGRVPENYKERPPIDTANLDKGIISYKTNELPTFISKGPRTNEETEKPG